MFNKMREFLDGFGTRNIFEDQVLVELSQQARDLIEGLIERYIESQVYQAVVENVACEQAAKMIAMKAATDNAGDLIDELQLIMNNARQAAITQELSEIIGSAGSNNWERISNATPIVQYYKVRLRTAPLLNRMLAKEFQYGDMGFMPLRDILLTDIEDTLNGPFG